MKDQTTSNREAFSVSPIARSYTSGDHLPPYYSQSLRGISPDELAARKRNKIAIIIGVVAVCIAVISALVYFNSSAQPEVAQPAAQINQPVEAVNPQMNAELAERTAKAREAVKAAEAAAKSAEAAVALAAANAAPTPVNEAELSAQMAHIARTHTIQIANEHVNAAWMLAQANIQGLENDYKGQAAKKSAPKPKPQPSAAPVIAVPAPKKAEPARPTDARTALPF